jgi:hypothetical protein
MSCPLSFGGSWAKATGKLPVIPRRFYTRRMGDTMMVAKFCGAGRAATGVENDLRHAGCLVRHVRLENLGQDQEVPRARPGRAGVGDGRTVGEPGTPEAWLLVPGDGGKAAAV